MKVSDLILKHPNWGLPSKCPLCGTELEVNDNLTRIFCPNENCKTYIMGRLNKWTNVLRIKEFGGSTLTSLTENHFVETISDLYNSENIKKLQSLEGYGARSVEILLNELGKKKSCKLSEFIAGYNISGIGLKLAQKVIDNCGINAVEDIFNKNANDFITEGIGPKTAEKLYSGLQAHKEDMKKTMIWVDVDLSKAEVKEGGKLAGLSFCFTGKACMPRAQLEKMVIDNGGTVSSVKKGLSYLITDDTGSGSAKNRKAAELGIQIMDSKSFVDLCSN